jgi:hypothetical protein
MDLVACQRKLFGCLGALCNYCQRPGRKLGGSGSDQTRVGGFGSSRRATATRGNGNRST